MHRTNNTALRAPLLPLQCRCVYTDTIDITAFEEVIFCAFDINSNHISRDETILTVTISVVFDFNLYLLVCVHIYRVGQKSEATNSWP